MLKIIKTYNNDTSTKCLLKKIDKKIHASTYYCDSSTIHRLLQRRVYNYQDTNFILLAMQLMRPYKTRRKDWV